MASKKDGIKVEPAKMRRSKPAEVEATTANKEGAVSAGPVDKAIELAFNPTREKIREVTVIDKMQGRLLPLLDIQTLAWEEIIEIAAYRQDAVSYAETYGRERPVPSNLMDEYMYRLAQWQKSVDGMNLGKITDIALAEMETKEDEDELGGSGDPYARD